MGYRRRKGQKLPWDFGTSRGYIGLTGAATTIFEGDPLAGTVREIIQNSLDAGNEQRVSIGVSLRSHQVSEMPGVQSATEPLREAFTTWLTRKGKSESDLAGVDAEELDDSILFYRSAIELTEAEEITVLAFHDWGTSGLEGPVREKEGVAGGAYSALVHNSGDNHKSTGTSLGSFGQGSKAPIALSQLRTVFYLTQILGDSNEDVESRFIGKALWSSAYAKPGGEPFTTETGFYSADDDLRPFRGEEIPAWARETRAGFTEGNGTSVFIPCPSGLLDVDEYERNIFTTVLLNFYFAIFTGKLEVWLPDGRKIDDTNVRSVVEESGILVDANLDEMKLLALQTLYFAQPDTHSGFRESEAFGNYYFAIRTGEDIPHRTVTLARDPGMVITSRARGLLRFSLQNFNMFVCVIGDRGRTVLRSAEPPTHDRLEFERIKEEKRFPFLRDYDSFASEIRQLAASYAELESAGIFEVTALSGLLGTIGDDQPEDARVEFPTKLKLVEGRKRSKQESVGPGSGALGPSGAGNSGGSGRGGGSGIGNQDGPGSGTRGARLKQTTRVLLEVAERSGVHTVFFSVDKPQDARSVRLFASGENQREAIRFSTTENGALVGELPKSSWSSVGTGNHRFKIAFYPESSLDSIEAWIEPKPGVTA